MFDVRRTRPGLLIFDGDCGFCTTCVRLMTRILPVSPRTIPYQWADLESYGLTEALARERVWLVTNNRNLGGHAAVSALLRYQPDALLRFVGWLMLVPPWSVASRVGYAVISRIRHKLPGGTPACQPKM